MNKEKKGSSGNRCVRRIFRERQHFVLITLGERRIQRSGP